MSTAGVPQTRQCADPGRPVRRALAPASAIRRTFPFLLAAAALCLALAVSQTPRPWAALLADAIAAILLGVALRHCTLSSNLLAANRTCEIRSAIIAPIKIHGKGRGVINMSDKRGVAREINDPLPAIAGRAEFALDKLRPDQPAVTDLKIIQTRTQRTAEIVRNLLSFSRTREVREFRSV